MTPGDELPAAVNPHSDWNPAALRAPELLASYARLRSECPVAFSADFGGFWTLSRYEDVRRAAADITVFRNGRPFLMDTGNEVFIPESLNPPEHTVYRRLLIPHFRPPRMAAFRPKVRALAAEHLGPLLEAGGDFVSQVAHPLPTRVLCAFLNLPDEMWRDIKAMTRERTVASMDGGRVAGTTGRLSERIKEIVDGRRRAPLDPAQDMISALLTAEIGGKPLTDTEIAMIAYQVIIAGADTTSATLGCAAFLLATHPDQQARLRAEPALVSRAVEEVLRLEPALPYMGRTVACRITLHGRTLPDGEAVALHYASANRDAAQFADPDAFDVTRKPNSHLTFGHGIHKCVGAPLARLEVAVVLEELLKQTTEFSLAGEAVRGSTFPSAFRSVPLRTRAGLETRS